MRHEGFYPFIINHKSNYLNSSPCIGVIYLIFQLRSKSSHDNIFIKLLNYSYATEKIQF